MKAQTQSHRKLKLNHNQLPKDNKQSLLCEATGRLGEKPVGARTSDEQAHAPRTGNREKVRHSLAWTRTLHFLQETRMLVPSSSR